MAEKAAIAGFLAAATLTRAPLLMILSAGGENGAGGVEGLRHLAGQLPEVGGLLVAAPTSNRPVIAHPGLVHYEVRGREGGEYDGIYFRTELSELLRTKRWPGANVLLEPLGEGGLEREGFLRIHGAVDPAELRALLQDATNQTKSIHGSDLRVAVHANRPGLATPSDSLLVRELARLSGEPTTSDHFTPAPGLQSLWDWDDLTVPEAVVVGPGHRQGSGGEEHVFHEEVVQWAEALVGLTRALHEREQ